MVEIGFRLAYLSRGLPTMSNSFQVPHCSYEKKPCKVVFVGGENGVLSGIGMNTSHLPLSKRALTNPVELVFMLYLSSRRQQGICGAKATCCQGHHGCLYLSKECVNPRIVGGGNNNNTVKSVGMVPSGSTRGLGLGPLLVYIYGATSKGPSIQFIFLPCPAGSYVGGTTQLFWLMHCICGFDAKKKSNFCESKPWFYSNTITRQAVASLADIGPSVLYLNLSALNPDKIGFCRA